MKNLKNKKGFTLVEIVVVLAIIAILAAILIPTMNGFVNDAKSKQHIAEARAAYVAAQYIVSRDGTNTASDAKIQKLSGITGTTVVTAADGKVTKIVFTPSGSGAKAVTIEAGKVTVAE
ncbi:MAG: prepilin-type N-terminal cleavage/methylation domain-containing protein [Erysipelotrichaceae bacterium]